MGNDTNTMQQGSAQLRLKRGEEVELWTRRLGCTEFELRKATAAVGTSVQAVRQYLSHRK